MHTSPTSTITSALVGRMPADPSKAVGRSRLAQSNPGQKGQASLGQQNERSHQRAQASDLRLRNAVGVPAHRPESYVIGANRGLLEAEKETANSHARRVLHPHRCGRPDRCGRPGAVPNDGHSRPLHGVRCSELVALKWSDFDWQNLSVYIRRAIVSGRVDAVKTEYSEAPLPLDPALAEVIFEWRRRTEFSADSDFVFASPFMAGEKPYTPWNMQHNHLSPAAVKAGLGPIGWHTLRHLQGVARRQWRTAYGAEGAHAARIHPDHAEYLRRGDDGIDPGSPWASGEAVDRALMDVSRRQSIA